MKKMTEYTDSVGEITAVMLIGFFKRWKKPHTPDDHLKILHNSDYIVLAIDREKNKVVGFITALTDNIQTAFIPLLEVLPDYRKQGIGSELTSRMLKKLKGIPAVDLTCDPDMQKVYSKFGMKPSVGMIIRDY
ncbi:MAG: GNAT family N-acetyltransferase [Candidatus Bipolaricaulota bacterium]|nr:GNAT family N-acetyltransferase [Candidatus Bipolaricaulota bacterium]